MINHSDEEIEIVQDYEKIPGTPENYHKLANNFEDSGNALAALGDLMINSDQESLSEFTFKGIGYLLNMLGDNMFEKCFETLDLAKDARQQKDESGSKSAQSDIEVSRSRV
ncbi:MAG: hypothetical protein H6936_09440 [Burkholderiales bacterium]|nr:hypothetical protein [Burkholderiales bacterium]